MAPQSMRAFTRVLLLAAASTVLAANAEPLPIKAFARLPAIDEFTIAPDGKHIAYITAKDDQQLVAVGDLQGSVVSGQHIVLASTPGKFEISWCNWAKNTRLLCGLRATIGEFGIHFAATRLFAVDADGSKSKVLLQGSSKGDTQLQDNVLDWLPDKPDTILMQMAHDGVGDPAVFELNIYTGATEQRVRKRSPITRFYSDGHGNVRLGTGIDGTDFFYYARLKDDDSWQLLTRFEVFGKSTAPVPLRVISGSDKAYATADYEGHAALWEVDLTDTAPPRLLFSHPQADAGDARFASDGHLLGVFYETERPFMFYIDPKANAVANAVRDVLPNRFVTITGYTTDESTYVVHSSSDIDGGTTYLFNAGRGKLTRMDTAYPELDLEQLSHKKNITYHAKDGTSIPGYLIVPNGKRAENLPLIVMPHGGPLSRDSWRFNFLEQFLASRGYAVLQMNFRGSRGYGYEWLHAAHQDWGGLSYSDITDGARWAVEQKIADPKRLCILGWSFGGYAALLGAVRNGDLYKCAVSIAGVSDLPDLIADARSFNGAQISYEQIGKNREKLIADSPRRHADKVNIPVLMIHGTSDYQVPVGHSRRMADALKSEKRPYSLVEIPDATHQISLESQRTLLLTEIEKFLSDNLGAKKAD